MSISPDMVYASSAPVATATGAAVGQSFFDTFACRSGDHCHTCRARTAGRAFRTSIAACFEMPTIDFPCPHGRPWDFKGSATQLPVSHSPAPATHQHPRAIASPEVTAESGSTPSTGSGQAKLTEIKSRFAICRTCEHSRDDAFAGALHSGCCFGKFRSNPASRCPAGRW